MRGLRRLYWLYLLAVLSLAVACGSDALSAGREALERGDNGEAVAKLRQAVDGSSGNADTLELYQKALDAYRDELRNPTVKVETCDGAVESLVAIEGFAGSGGAVEGEQALLGQALLCAARHRARKGQGQEAAEVIVEGMKRLPGFEPGSPVLSKALREPAEKAARAGQVIEATALAQVLFSSGEPGLALSIIDMLLASGTEPGDIYPVLAERANRAKTSDAAAGVAAGFATWYGHPGEASRWYDEMVSRASKEGGAGAKGIKRYASLRSEEASRLAEFQAESCTITAGPVDVVTKLSAIPSLVAAGVGDGLVVAWIEGQKIPDQQLKVARLGFDGAATAPVVVAKSMPVAEKAGGGDVVSAYAPKNRETSLALVECGENLELAARGAPSGSWARATLSKTGQVARPLASFSKLGPTGHMPSEDVWWNVGCSHGRLVHMWLADTQLMRIAWFTDGESAGDPANLRIPGFSPWFVTTGAEEEATRLYWIDIMGEGMSQILGVTIPEDGEIPLAEDGTNVAGQPVVESIEGRVEHIRLEKVGERYALTYVPFGGDIMVRWIDESGRNLGSPSPVARLRQDATKVRFDSAAVEGRLGVAWTELVTDEWAALYFQTIGQDGNNPSQPQRITGLVRPDITPVLIGSGGSFAVVWVQRSDAAGEAIRAATLRCGQ